MITSDNYSEAHIRELQSESKADPILIERTLYAFGLLEALKKVGLDFIFKGGTSLMLLLPEPRRLSTDIDIVVKPDTDIDSYIQEASKIFPFREKEEQHRIGKNNIVKRHFKFTYDSPIKGQPFYILLDVLFEHNHYKRVIEKEISNGLLLTEGENLKVTIPTADCILGDKMTAFAPHTTGIPLNAGKDLEVIKQYFDVCNLIEVYDNFDDLRQTYFDVSGAELAYRGNPATSNDAILDTIQAAICIGARGNYRKDEFPYYVNGTKEIVTHIFGRKYNMEAAYLDAPKVIYMAACLLTGHPFEKDVMTATDRDEKIMEPDLLYLKSFRKLRTNGYEYLVRADKLLREYSIQ